MTRSDLIERAAAAYERASCPHRHGPYGLFDYTSYGSSVPHVVRDLRDMCSVDFNKVVFRSTCRDAAQAEYDRLNREHIFGAVVDAVLADPTREAASPN